MSDPNAGAQLSLAEALRALPLAAPERDVWQTLAAELAPARRPARRHFVPLAIAAGLLMLAAAVLLRAPAPTPAPLATVTPAPASNVANDANDAKATSGQGDTQAQLAALEARSEDLERWLRDTHDAAAPLPGQDLAAAAELEDLIGLVDVQLASTSQGKALPLWRHRVNLLEDLTALRYSNDRLAGTLANAGSGEAPNRIN